MNKKIITLLLYVVMIFSLVGCSKEVTLNLSFGDRTGKYTGDLVDGKPDGNGKFITQNEEGQTWTYEGEFKDGHFEGEGKTTWESGQVEIGTYKDDVIVPIKEEEVKTLYTSPEKLKNHCVQIIGQVFTAPEYADDMLCIQMYADYKNFDNNVVVYINDTNFEVEQNDYIKITGIVGEVLNGENVFGAELSVPTIVAREYEKMSYIDAVTPTLKTVDVNQTKEQLGYSITVQKIEFAEEETRVYVKVTNQGSAKFNLYTFNTKLTQDGKQYEEEDNWDGDYPKIQSNLLVGNSTEGIITFPAIEQKDFDIIFECYSENYNEDIQPYYFNIVF